MNSISDAALEFDPLRGQRLRAIALALNLRDDSLWDSLASRIFLVGAIDFRSNLGILDTGALWVPGNYLGKGLAMDSTQKKSRDRPVHRSDRLK
jgi:hypothetical protein